MPTLQEYKCPCCNGAIHFDSNLQKMKCPYCDTEFTVEALEAQDEARNQNESDEMHWDTAGHAQWQDGEAENMYVYSCRSCGGEIVCEETTGATACPYCGNPVVIKRAFAGELRPDLIIPFALDKDAAKRALNEHLKGKRLLPKVFKSQNHLDEIKGVYVPFWLFDGDANADMRYHATRLHAWSDSQFNYTETQHFSLFRSGSLSFAHVPVDGSAKMPDDLMESLEPYDTSKAVDFKTAYLAGYLADKYDVGAEQCIGRANERIRESTQETFRRTADNYATVTPEYSSIKLANGKTKYALYPVWLLNTTWQGNQYLFAMNGQTGKFVGNLPMEKGAFWRWFCGVGAAVFAAVLGILLLIHGIA